MTATYYRQLAERVVTTFLFAFLAAWTVGLGATPALDQIGNLSVAQKAAAAGGAAVLQLLLSVFVAPHVGDPNSPSLLPKRFTGSVSATAEQKSSVVVSVDDVIGAVLSRLGTKVPPGVTVTAEDVANELINQTVKVWQPSPSVTPPAK